MGKKEKTFVKLGIIRGFEGLRDGTQYIKLKSEEEFFDEIYCASRVIKKEKEFFNLLNTPKEDEDYLIDDLCKLWKERCDEGGGSGWLEDYCLDFDTFFEKFVEFCKNKNNKI